jgi:hypothetical protein
MRIDSPWIAWPLAIGCVAAVLAVLPARAFAQAPSPSPGFGQTNLIALSEQVSSAWDSWEKSQPDLEQSVFSLPMVDARTRIQRALSDFLAYLDRRRQYSDAVATYIESFRLNPGTRPAVTAEAVSSDQVQLLGISLTRLQAKLEALRAAPAWAQIRRSLQQDRSDVLALQASRRGEITVDRPLDRSRAAAPSVSPIVYRESERQTRDALQKLWTRYYQSLVDAVEQKPAGSAPLITKLPVTPAPGGAATVTPVAANAAPADNNPLTCTWIYTEGSQQFNGVAEPHKVMLELWMEQGLLLGRYRAELPAFDGTTKHVDLNLRGRFTPGHDQTLEFRSADPDASGKVVIEGPGSTGLDLMLVRVVESRNPIPRGRESLSRR